MVWSTQEKNVVLTKKITGGGGGGGPGTSRKASVGVGVGGPWECQQ